LFEILPFPSLPRITLVIIALITQVPQAAWALGHQHLFIRQESHAKDAQ